MKKKIALLLAAVMVVGSLPMTAFASTDNYVSAIKTVEDGDKFSSNLYLEEFKGIEAGARQTIRLTLTNAKFVDQEDEGGAMIAIDATDLTGISYLKKGASGYETGASNDWAFAVGEYKGIKYLVYNQDSGDDAVDNQNEIYQYVDITSNTKAAADLVKDLTKLTGSDLELDVNNNVVFTEISDTVVMAEFDVANTQTGVVIPLSVEADGSGDATVTIESVDSVVSSQTLKIATIAGGATTATIGGTVSITEKGTEIKNIVITETTAGSMEAGIMRMKLTNGFSFNALPEKDDIVIFGQGSGNLTISDIDWADTSHQEIEITFEGSTKNAATISIPKLTVAYDEDDVEVGDECEVTISGAGTTKQSLVIGTAADYGVSFSVEDKDLPTFYAGRYDDDVETLVVTIKENIENSWLDNRKTSIVFPEGVEVMAVTEDDRDKLQDNWTYDIDENEVELDIEGHKTGGKAELALKFELSVSPDFTGDIEATLTGSGIGDDQTVTVGTAAFPVTVDADVNELMIDYRNTAASDIVITEADAGVLEKGKTVSLYIDGIDFDGTPSVEVESGDMKIENVKVTPEGELQFKVKTASQKEAAVIRISDIELYMSRSLPAGEYDLVINAMNSSGTVNGNDIATAFSANDAIIQNYSEDHDDSTGYFDVDEVTALEGYVTVVTAGRDQGDETFTTTVAVTIGADKMYAGTKEIALDVPAYISNGYTMMPVRAVTEALSGSAIVRWDDPTKTVTITFGQRVISMTVGSNVMKINGVDVAMQAQCEITDSRAFIPLRDLGYALGLNDSKIGWDDATKTATLN